MVSDSTYVSTWSGFVYVAFVVEPRGRRQDSAPCPRHGSCARANLSVSLCSPDIDAFARRIVGWRVSRSAHAGFVPDALEQARHERRPVGGRLIRHSDRGGQYASIKYCERLAEAGIEPSAGSVGDSYDNALAETIDGPCKAEVIHRRGPWRSLEAV